MDGFGIKIYGVHLIFAMLLRRGCRIIKVWTRNLHKHYMQATKFQFLLILKKIREESSLGARERYNRLELEIVVLKEVQKVTGFTALWGR